MTQEEKAKAYDEALERAKKYMAKGYDVLMPEIFPQLRESEDERMMKNIRLALLSVEDAFWRTHGLTAKEAISYLEKQKEQKHPNGCFTCDEYKKGYEEGRRNGFTAGYNKAMKEVEQKEQKPTATINGEPIPIENHSVDIPLAEWSEEDSKRYISIGTTLETSVVLSKEDYDANMSWLRNLVYSQKYSRPKPQEEIYQAAKHDLAIKFMNYLDENRPEGKMSLSSAECEDIDKAFKENDWAKILRYAEKYGK